MDLMGFAQNDSSQHEKQRNELDKPNVVVDCINISVDINQVSNHRKKHKNNSRSNNP